MLGHSLVYLIIAGLAGLTMAVQGSLNSMLGKKLGIVEASFIVHLTATLILIVVLVLNIKKGNITVWRQVPWYFYLGGLFGVIISFTVIVSIPKLGVAVATTAIITAQVSTAAVIDHFGVFGLERLPFTWIKFIGIIFLGIGVRLLLAK